MSGCSEYTLKQLKMTVKGHERPLLLPWRAGEGRRSFSVLRLSLCVERGQFANGSFVVIVVVLFSI